MSFLSKNKSIFVLLLLGITLRLIYTFFFSPYVAQSYFGLDSLFSEAGEIRDWLIPIKNLIHTGSYTHDITNEYGYFSRMPGYPFFIGIFYWLFGEPYFMHVIGYTQVILDSANIYFIYRIYSSIFPESKYKYLAPLLYAIHPINIFWAPTLFSETLSIFLLMWSLYIYTCKEYRYKYFYIGIILGFDILVRPQIAVFVAIFIAFYVFKFFLHCQKKSLCKNLLLFLFGITISYGLWPARNYILHDKLILTHDIKGIDVWGVDVFAFMQYIFSIQPHWDPQMSQIVNNQPFEITTKIAYVTPTDSADLARAVYLAKNHGSGFSSWSGYWKNKVERNKQDTVIAALFNKLHQNQIRYNAFHYWIINPLENLKKCFFKFSTEHSISSGSFKLSSFIFIFRSIIIILGLIGSILLIKNHTTHSLCIMIILFFGIWYLALCFGPTSFMRNVELRYLLQADTLMLFPASYLLELLSKKTFSRHE